MSGFIKNRLRIRRAIVPIIPVLALALLVPGTASAENCSSVGNDPTAAQYCSATGVHPGQDNGNKGADATHTSPVVSGADDSNTPTATPEAVTTESVESSGSSLPFTGLDAVLLLGIGAALVAMGFVLFRLSRLRVDPR
jgi:hypothetical protein